MPKFTSPGAGQRRSTAAAGAARFSAALMELGAVVITTENEQVVNVRLSAEGIDLYEQLILRKYDF